MNFTKRLSRGNFYLTSHNFEIWRFIRGMEFGNKCKIPAQYLKNYTPDRPKNRDMRYVRITLK